MSRSRLFFCNAIKATTGLVVMGGIATIVDRRENKRYLDIQKQHPDKTVTRQFYAMPMIGGYWQINIHEKRKHATAHEQSSSSIATKSHRG